MSKLTTDINSKLSETKQPKTQSPASSIPEKIMSTYKKRNRTQSFSLKEKDQERLENILTKAQNHSTKKLSSTDILRGLLIIGEKTNIEKIMENINISFLE
tara:strand:+ start:952 stop:1254 length:303 start_codon:yes stop_codon:yes gene_type:complete